MKKYILLLTLLLVSLSTSAYPFRDNRIYEVISKYDFIVNGIYYSIISKEDKTVSVSYCMYKMKNDRGCFVYINNYQGDVVIPQTVEYDGIEYDVTSIGDKAFENSILLNSVVIPNSVKEIGKLAFAECYELTSVRIPNSVTQIGKEAFAWCSRLTYVTIPNNVTSLPNGIFYKCERLVSVDLSNHITSIDSYSFFGCSQLTLITIPDDVTCIGDHAFYGCNSLSSIDIPDKVTIIGEKAFAYCSNLTWLTIGNSVTSFGADAVMGCDNLEIITLLCSNIGDWFKNSKSLMKVVLGEDVSCIGEEAFYNCSNLKKVTFGNSVTVIAAHAFEGCNNLTSIAIPNSVTSIGESAFYECSSLSSVAIPNSVTSIGEKAFLGCTSLTSVTIPNSVTSIGEKTFARCSSLTSITISNRVTEIAAHVFDNCSSLASFAIPNSVTSIGAYAFHNCSNFTSVTIPNSVTSIGEKAFKYCSSMTSITISNRVTEIAANAFEGCSSLTSVAIPNSVTSIGANAFMGCTNLTSVSIPNSVTSIGRWAFEACGSLLSVTIPNSVTSIGDRAFYGCGNLTKVVSKIEKPFKISSEVFEFYWIQQVRNKTMELIVPNGTLSIYRKTNYWNKFDKITESPLELPNDDSISDGNVDYADIEDIKNYIMGSPSGNFNTEKADYNGDGSVNVADIVSIIDNNKWITVTDNFSKSIPFTKIRVLNNKSVSDQYCCVAFSTSPNEDIGTDRFYINFSSLTIGDNNPTNISWGNPITNYKHVGGNWYEYEFSCPVYFAYYQDNCPRGQVKVCIDATYTQLDYIERDPNHTAEIGNIGVTLNDYMKFQLKVYPTNGGGQWIIGNDGTNDKDDYRLFWAGSNGAGDAKIYLDYGDDGVSGVGRRLLTASSISSLYELEVGNYYVKDLTNNNYILSGSTVTNANVDRTIGVFGNNDFGRIYYLKVFDGNILIKNLIPVRRDCDGFVTLYDTISKTYLNTIAGTFKASDE